MNKLSRLIPFSVPIVLLVCVFSCCDRISTTQIKQIQENPRQFSEKEVAINGQVVDTFSFIVVKYFSIRDDSGEIAVVTNKPLPKKGETIKVKGKVQEAFSLGTETLLVIIETEK
jgi:aspartyl/asparaginyl-tRNA synthetase